MMTRGIVIVLLLFSLVGLALLDMKASPPNPYTAPAIVALGSGVAASGGFCGDLPN